MIKIGKRQKMRVNNISSIGAYLDAETGDAVDNVLLPNNEIEDMGIKEGDELDVLIYCDSEDRIIATLKSSYAVVGTLARLEVVDITKIGAFLDWGLPKDLFLPKGQEEGALKKGKSYLVGLYEDKKGRISATMKIYKFLLPNSKYEKNDIVLGTVYRIEPNIGTFVAVDNRYFGLIPKNECFIEYEVGDEVEARVIRVREDGKIDLSPRKLSYLQIDDDAQLILEAMENIGGKLLINDKSSPELIKETFGLSKKAFKKAIGNLLKNGKIIKDGQNFRLN